MKNEIAKLRVSRGISQANLQKLTGISQQMICRIETGQSEISVIDAINISKALGCKVSDLFLENTESFANLDNVQPFLQPGDLLRNIRELSGVPVAIIANALEVSEKAYNKYEQGHIEIGGKIEDLSNQQALNLCHLILNLASIKKLSEDITGGCPTKPLNQDDKEILTTFQNLANADKRRALALINAISNP